MCEEERREERRVLEVRIECGENKDGKRRGLESRKKIMWRTKCGDEQKRKEKREEERRVE